MITDAIMDFLHGIFTTLFDWLSTHLPSAPDWWIEAGDAVNTVLGNVGAPIRYFLPLGPLLRAAIALMVIMVALGLLRLARRAVSLFTGGGGMA